jgi:hypothetical protein
MQLDCMLRSSGWDKEVAAIARLVDRRFLLPAIRKIIPRTPVIGRRIDIHWLSDGRPANSVAFSGHALGINGVISHLQGATGGIGIPCSNSTTCNQTGAGAQRRTRSHISRHRTDCGTRDGTKRRANGSGTDRCPIGRLARGLVPNRLLS